MVAIIFLPTVGVAIIFFAKFRLYGTTWVDWILEKPKENIYELENQKNKNEIKL